MSEKTAVEQFADSVLSYKNPTNLNGTDYIMISINKVEYLKEKFKEVEKEQNRILIDALNDIAKWNEEIREQWVEQEYRAKSALGNYNENINKKHN